MKSEIKISYNEKSIDKCCNFYYYCDNMPSIDKVHDILELLRIHYKTGKTNKEISETLKIPPSTCYRILASLKKHDMVYQRRPDLHYFLGFAHLRYAEAVLEGMDIAAICLPYLEDLHQETEETTFFALLNGYNCVAMEMCGFTNARISIGRGEIMPLYCSAAGKAVLAFFPKRERNRIIKDITYTHHTSNTIQTFEKMEQEIEQIRKTGTAYNIEEFHNGINAMATPIFANSSRVIGSLAIVGTSVDLDRDTLEEYSELFLSASSEISNRLGGSFPNHLL